MKIKHVYGNVLKLDIPLTIKIRTMEGDVPTEREEPFYPDVSKGCAVILSNSYNRKIQYDATVSGNVAHIEDDGVIGIGTYKVTVKCYDKEGNPYRYMVRDIIEICDATIDAGIEAGVEFNAETYTLEGAVFIAYGGGSFEQVQADWTETDIRSKAYIKNKPTNIVEDDSYVHTDNNYTDEDKSKLNSALQSETDPTVPSWAKQPNKPRYTAQDVGALPNSTKYGSTIDLAMDSATYVLTLSLKDQDGTVLNTKTVDLPIESVVVNGKYDAANKKIVLTLQSGSTIDVPVGDLIAGLQTEITSVNMLDADLVDDTNSTHKFVTAQEKQAWNNKSDFSGDYNDLRNKPTIPVVPTNVSAFTNDAGYLTQHQDISGKEDKTAIVATSTASGVLNTEVGKYYRIDVAVDTLAVTLPAMTDLTTVRTVVIYLTAGTTPAVTITSADSKNVYYQDGFEIEAGSTYEINALFNGAAWIVAAVKINVE